MPPSPELLIALDDAVHELIRSRGDARVHAEVRARAGLDLSNAELLLLRTLGERDAIRPGDLADICSLDQSTISRQMRRLERERLVRRQPDPDDGRAAILTLTNRGRDAYDRLVRGRTELLTELLADWTDRDANTTTKLLQRLATALQKADQLALS